MEISRQLAFINNHYGFTISLINGDHLIDEISKIHNIGPHALDFYKKTVLGSTQLINYLKASENLGFYIDSEEPFFRFKIEMSSGGTLRTLLLPEDFDELPQNFTGKCRIHKTSPGKSPYTSVLDYQNFKIEEISNDVLQKSYQTNATILFSNDFINSALVTKLPPTNINKKIEDFEDIKLNDFISTHKDFLDEILSGKFQKVEELEKIFKQKDFTYLGSKEVKFHCPCSHERMVENLFTLKQEDRESLFETENSIETRCDYCNTLYEIKKEEILKSPLH